MLIVSFLNYKCYTDVENMSLNIFSGNFISTNFGTTCQCFFQTIFSGGGIWKNWGVIDITQEK